MITRYSFRDGRLVERSVQLAGLDVEPAIWIDLCEPSSQERANIEEEFGIELPSRDEMKEIELSSRLYQEGPGHFMTTTLVYKVESMDPLSAEVTFVLTEKCLITLRFASPRAFQIFANRAERGDVACGTPEAVVAGLLDCIVEREADLIEMLQSRTETTSKQIFEMKGHDFTRARRYSVSLKEIGRISVLISRVRESLASQGRLLAYFRNLKRSTSLEVDLRDRIDVVQYDVQSLSAHADHISTRLCFLMDATIGLVSIEQNQIIKLFSVVAVMLMPPTLIASIYGMNFQFMPELHFAWGYPIVLITMVVSALVPFIYFKKKGWF